MRIRNAQTPLVVHHGDTFLLKEFNSRGFKPRIMYILNKCRIYLHIITVADIANPHGTQIEKWAIKGRRTKHSHIQWPQITEPTKQEGNLGIIIITNTHGTRHQLITSNRKPEYEPCHQYTPTPYPYNTSSSVQSYNNNIYVV